MAWLLRKIRRLVSRDFRMREACGRLPQDQLALVRQLDAEATCFRNSMDHTAEMLQGSGMQYEMIQRAAAARERRYALVEQCTNAGVPQELIDYFGSLGR